MPEEAGLDSSALTELFDYVREQKTPIHSLQIVRHGRLVVDAYFYPFRGELRHDVASVTKSVTSTLIGLAIDKGRLRDLHQPILSFFPNRVIQNSDERKNRITLEHLLTMQAGWDCGFEPKEARLSEMRRSNDWLQFMLDLPMVASPGTRFAYCSGNPHLLSIVLSQTTGTNALAFARRELFEPLGIQDIHWPADPNGHTHGWGDLQLGPRDMAKLGQLFLQRGRWANQQILSESWIAAATSNHVERTVNKDHYGYAWWVKSQEYPGMFEAVGRGGQRITVWPAKDMVIVFTGGEFEPGDLAKFILKALKSDGTLSPNPKSVTQLQERIMTATRPLQPRPVPKLPAIAKRVSGKPVRMSTNTLDLRELTLKFNDSSEAEAELLVAGHHEKFKVGLDGVDRFSPNTLVDLPTACIGQWVDQNAFLLRINFVGGINCYDMKLDFSDQPGRVAVHLKERSGLNDEQFTGVLSE